VNNGTPLYYAAYKGHMSIVTLLLDAGANLSSDDWGNTPISASIVKGHKNIVELLRAAEVNGWKRKRSS